MTIEEKILKKEEELVLLKEKLLAAKKKKKSEWIKNIIFIIKNELEMLYDENNDNLDLELISLFLYSLENKEILISDIHINDYVFRDRKKIKKREKNETYK